jgi:hypothetical protein
MQLGETQFEYYIDYINKKIHLLDWTQRSSGNLVNNISPDYQKRFLEAEALMQDVIDFDWIIYGSDGLISSYRNYNFKILNVKLPYLHKPYKVICESRKNRR